MKFPPGYVPGVGTPQPVTSSFGERLLASMGWEKGQGLGKNQHGITEAITVKNKQDTKGVIVGEGLLQQFPTVTFVTCPPI